MSDRIEKNQPFQLIITCIRDGVIVDFSDVTITNKTINYQSPEQVESAKFAASILNPPGTDGKIYIDIPINTFNEVGDWEAKPYVTFGTDEFPGSPVTIPIVEPWQTGG
jgi:hypothetical protein